MVPCIHRYHSAYFPFHQPPQFRFGKHSFHVHVITWIFLHLFSLLIISSLISVKLFLSRASTCHHSFRSFICHVHSITYFNQFIFHLLVITYFNQFIFHVHVITYSNQLIIYVITSFKFQSICFPFTCHQIIHFPFTCHHLFHYQFIFYVLHYCITYHPSPLFVM